MVRALRAVRDCHEVSRRVLNYFPIIETLISLRISFIEGIDEECILSGMCLW